MRKRLITLLLTISMVTTIFAGCGKNETAESTSKGTETKVTSESTAVSESTEVVEEIPNFNPEGYPVVDEEITLKVLISIQDSRVDALAEISEMPGIQMLTEKTGIKTEWEIIRASEWDTKINLIMATGEYPDVIIGTFDVESYGVAQGVIIPIDDLVEKYAPNVTERAAMESYDVLQRMRATDGKLYAFPNLMAENNQTYANLAINQSWLDNLKLEVPTDVESLTEVLRAIKAGDANGNGDTTDEIPMSLVVNTATTPYHVSQVMGLFGLPLHPKHWIYIDNNKQVQFAPNQEAFREAMEWLHTCYDEGLLDIESLSQDANTVGTKLKTGKIGFAPIWRLVGNFTEKSMEEQYALWIPEEAVMHKTTEYAANKIFITSANEYPEATVRWLDTWLEKEIMFTLYYDEQNQEKDPTKYGWYYDENGMINTNSLPKDLAERRFLSNDGMFFAPANWYFGIRALPNSTIQKAEFSAAYKEAGIMQKYSNTYLDLAPLTNDQLTSANLIKTDAATAVAEAMALFIKDGVTDKTWNEFQNNLKSIGVDDYVKMYQDGIDKLDLGE